MKMKIVVAVVLSSLAGVLLAQTLTPVADSGGVPFWLPIVTGVVGLVGGMLLQKYITKNPTAMPFAEAELLAALNAVHEKVKEVSAAVEKRRAEQVASATATIAKLQEQIKPPE